MPDTATNARMLHTMIRVHDLDKSLDFSKMPEILRDLMANSLG